MEENYRSRHNPPDCRPLQSGGLGADRLSAALPVQIGAAGAYDDGHKNADFLAQPVGAAGKRHPRPATPGGGNHSED